MSTAVTVQETAAFLRKSNNILILAHASPDGDTIGSSHALCRALRQLGKTAAIACSDKFPAKYGYLTDSMEAQRFQPRVIVSIDIADEQLFGAKLRELSDKVDLCIDHHVSNTGYAKKLLLDTKAAAACEVMVRVVEALGVPVDSYIASAIYTGLSSDTGCFRYSNTTPATLRCAASMAEKGADTAAINKILFETVSISRMKVESAALSALEILFDGRAAVMTITLEMLKNAGAADDELEGLASLPARLEGVEAGVTIKEKSPGVFKISMRTNGKVNASQVCAKLGGGGHPCAAGCELTGTLEHAKETIIGLLNGALN